MTILRSIWKAARKWKNTNSSPLTDCEPPADDPPRKRIYTDAEIERILKALGYEGIVSNGRQETAVAMLLSLETALRSSEMLSSKWEHVHLSKRYARLPNTKNEGVRDVPLSIRAIELIRKMEGRDVDKVFRLSESKRDQYFRQARNLAEVKGATISRYPCHRDYSPLKEITGIGISAYGRA